MLDPSQVSAVLVTRGDVDLAPIVAALPYDDIVIWDNSKRERDMKVYGRYLAIDEAKHDVIFFQDDDAIFVGHDELLASYSPGVLTMNMDDAWIRECGYEDSGMLGFGAICDRGLPAAAIARYAEFYVLDEWFLLYADLSFTILTPERRHIDIGRRTILPHGYDRHRMFAQPDFSDSKEEMKRRARGVRDHGAYWREMQRGRAELKELT